MAMRGTFSNRIISTGSSFQASSISHTPRSVRRLSAWYFSVLLLPSESRPLKPLHGADRKMMCGRSWPAARWTSAAVASTQPAGGVRPWKASYWLRSKRSSTVPFAPASRSKSRIAAGVDIDAADAAALRLHAADARVGLVEAARAAAEADERMKVADLDRRHAASPSSAATHCRAASANAARLPSFTMSASALMR